MLKLTKLIRRILKTKEISKIYSHVDFSLDSITTMTYFDLHLILLRNIKSDLDTKIDPTISLKVFYDLGLLKNNKYPLFILKENRGRSINNFMKIDKFFLEDLIEDYDKTGEIPTETDLIFFYQNYLPSSFPIYGLKYTEVSDFIIYYIILIY